MVSTEPVFKMRKIDEKVKDILRNNRLYLASPSTFNDPFDASIEPVVDVTDDELKNWILNQLERQKGIITPEQRAKTLHTVETGEYKTKEMKEGVIKGWMEGLKEFGICSLTQNISNILLWSHYGDNHRGVAIGIEVGKLRSPIHKICEVHYSSEFPIVPVHDMFNYQEILRRKYLCWEYEKEVRVLKGGAAGQYIDLPDGAITHIVFGMKCPETEIQKVIEWVNPNKMNPQLVEAIPKKGKYELEFRPHEPGKTQEFPTLKQRAAAV